MASTLFLRPNPSYRKDFLNGKTWPADSPTPYILEPKPAKVINALAGDLKKSGNDGYLCYLTGLAYEELGKRKEAKEYFQLAINQKDTPTHFRISAREFLKTGSRESLIIYYDNWN